MAKPHGDGRDRRHTQGRGVPPGLDRARPPGARSLRALVRGGGLHRHRGCHRQHFRAACGQRRQPAPGHDREPSRQPADRRQVRRRLRRHGRARGDAHAERPWHHHQGAARDGGVDERGGLALRPGHDRVRRLRRQVHPRLRPRPQGRRRDDVRGGAGEDRLQRQGAGRRPAGRRLLRGAHRAGSHPRGGSEDDRRGDGGTGPALV